MRLESRRRALLATVAMVVGATSLATSAGRAAASTAAPSPVRASQAAQARPAVQAAAADWPTYLHDPQRSDASADSTITPANVGLLQQRFAASTGGVLAAEPVVSNGIVYVGSWDGYEYAFNGTTGALVWKTYLGTINDPPCVPPTMGITSSATVWKGVVYVGGANDANNQEQWYALSASTGQVLWSVPTGLGTQAGGYYNWSSPLIATDPGDGNDYAYIGIASVCDAPLIPGALLKVSLTSHQVVGTASMVDSGQVGGGIWTSPTYDSLSNRVFVSSGTLNLYSQTLSQAVVAVNATSMAVVDHWQLPFEAAVSDSDWGTTPTLTTDANGDHLVSLANKNGVLYTLNRDNLAAGPTWQQPIAYGGDCPTCGDGSISSGAFAGGVLYYAGGSNSDSTGGGHSGSVTAFNAGTGAVLWKHETNYPILGSIIADNGVILVANGRYMEALDASSGRSLWDWNLGTSTYAAPSVANGTVYVGGVDGRLRAFGLPAQSPSPPPPDANCPSGFTCQDIGNPGIAGGETVNSNGSVTVTASGDGRQNGDQMRIITRPATGDFQVGVKDLSESAGNLTGYRQPQLGIVVRQSSALGAPFYVALQDPTYPSEGESVANLIIFFRDTWNGPVVELTQNYPEAFPRWIMVQRHGDTFQTLSSGDGVNYMLISGTVHTVVMPATLLVGMGVASGTTSATTTAVYTGFTVAAPSQQYAEQVETHACPASWNCYDVGAGSPIGDNTLSNGVWTMYGGGAGVNLLTDGLGNNRIADQFHYVYGAMTGDGTVTGRLTALANGQATAQTTLMMRADTTAGSPFYGVIVTPNGVATLQWRTLNGIQQRTTISLGTQSLPAWFQVNRYTDTRPAPAITYYSLLTSGNGTAWNEVSGSTVALDLGAHPLAGIGGSSADPKSLNQSTWDNVSLTAGSSAPPGVCPQGYTCQDIGNGYAPGGQQYANGTWSFTAGGPDIWDVFDGFHYVYQPLTRDGTVSAQVTSAGPANYADDFEKAGIMLRQTTDARSPYYGVFVTPQHGLAVQWRTTSGATTNQVLAAGPSPEYPVYVMVGRWTDPHPGGQTYYTAYSSTDNRTFTAISGSTVALTLPGTLLAGMAADSYNEQTTLAVTFNNFALFDGTEAVPPGACPPSMTGCADIGGAQPAGSQTLTGTSLAVTAGGGDIWQNYDLFHFDWQTLAGDGAVSAQVASQQNTGEWAKAGVMLRAAADPGAAYYAVFTTPGHGIAVQWRTAQTGTTQQLLSAGTVPVYLKVSRYTAAGGGQYYAAFTSRDGTAWTWLANSTVLLQMSGTVLAGWAADSWSQSTASQVTFNNIALTTTSTAPPGLPPPATVTAVVPNQASALGGATITLNGSGFTGATSVHVGAVLATNVTVTGDSLITAMVPPAAAGTVDVTVSTPVGTGAPSGTDRFTYVEPNLPTQRVIDTHQFTLAGSDGVTWQPLSCPVNVATATSCSAAGTPNPVTAMQLTLTPTADGTALLNANSDLWTQRAGYNQDIAIFVADGGGAPTLAAWKESGGFAGTFSPNAAFVQTAYPVLANHTYTVSLRWKTNHPAPAGGDQPIIMAGAGPITGTFSPTSLSAVVLPKAAVTTATSTNQYNLAGSDGTTWEPMSCTAPGPTTCTAPDRGPLTLQVTPQNDGEALIGANSDLWTQVAGFNQDIAIFVTDGGAPTPIPALAAWKESGGFAGTYSPNAAFLQTTQHFLAGHTYTIDLRWKTNRPPRGGEHPVITAGAGPIGVDYSPTRLTVALLPAGNDLLASSSTRQFALTGNDGSTWVPLSCGSAPGTTCGPDGTGDAVRLDFTPSQTCSAVVTGNADLWTATTSFNQDIGIFISADGSKPVLAAWKESGGFAGTYSPNAATVQDGELFHAGVHYVVDLRWKSNRSAGMSDQPVLFVAAGPISGNYSPTSLVAALTSCH